MPSKVPKPRCDAQLGLHTRRSEPRAPLRVNRRASPCFFDRGDVHEHILAAVIGLNESLALCRVEPLHRSSCHLGRLPYPIGPKDNPFGRQAKPAGVSRVSVSRCELGRPRVQKGMRDRLTKVSAVPRRREPAGPE
jgi:hypothetical protein